MRIRNLRLVWNKKFPRYDIAVGGLLTEIKDDTNELCRPNGSSQLGRFMTIIRWYLRFAVSVGEILSNGTLRHPSPVRRKRCVFRSSSFWFSGWSGTTDNTGFYVKKHGSCISCVRQLRSTVQRSNYSWRRLFQLLRLIRMVRLQSVTYIQPSHFVSILTQTVFCSNREQCFLGEA
jgi:hypothetical protein